MHSAHLEHALKELYQTRFAPALALSANWDADKQALDIEQLVRKAVDLLLVEPMSSPYAASAVNQASSSGLPVILVSSPLEAANCVTWVTTDEEERARASVEWLARQASKGRIIVLQSEPCQGSGSVWVRSARNALTKFAELQVDYLTSFWTPAEAKRVMLAALVNGPAPVGLVVNHGTVAQGAVDALVERGMAVPPVAGVDDNNGWLRTAREHGVTFLGFGGSTRLGKKAIEVASLVLSGERVAPVVTQPQTAFGAEELDRLHRPDLTDHYWADHELPGAWIQAMFARQS
jgi:ABC-type sugar transport system substrate-binding protein